MSALRFIVLACIVSLAVACRKWDLYKQCDSRWGSHRLGTSPTETICSAGCAMSDVAMTLASVGIRIQGKEANPGTLNDWLTANGGYISHDLLVWNAIASLGNVSLETYTARVSQSQLKTYVDSCHPVVVNVRGGTHWVLITGATNNPNVWRVNDPGFNQDTYEYSTMLRFVVYRVGRKGEEAHQEEPARLDAAF